MSDDEKLLAKLALQNARLILLLERIPLPPRPEYRPE